MHIFSQHDHIDTHSPYESAKIFLDRLELLNKNFSQSVTYYNRHFENRINNYQLVNMLDNNKIQKCPAIKFKSWRRKTNQNQWIHDISMGNNGDFFEISGKIKKSTIRLTGNNIHSFSIQPDETPIDKDIDDVRIFYNGEKTNYKYLPDDRKILVEITKREIITKFLFSKNQFVEGPVWEVFGGPFLFVKGQDMPELWASSCDKMVNQWNTHFHTDIQICTDNLNDSLKSQNNLVLFGNSSSNKIINQIAELLPVKTYHDAVVFGDQIFKSPDICYQYCYPNPFNPEKYVLIIGGNNMENFLLYQNMPWYDGTSDYYIWSSENGKPKIITQGNFDYKWEVSNTY